MADAALGSPPVITGDILDRHPGAEALPIATGSSAHSRRTAPQRDLWIVHVVPRAWIDLYRLDSYEINAPLWFVIPDADALLQDRNDL
jgi:hypothetical protein